MNCREIQKKISAHRDEEIAAAISRGIMSHIAECAVCREESEAFQQADDLLKSLPKYEMPPEFAGQTILKLQASLSGPRTRKSHWIQRIFNPAQEFFTAFFELLEPSKRLDTPLKELGDFPPLSICYIYFKKL